MGTAGGALGGAMTGAKLGSIVPGVGTAVGAVAGGLLGGLGGSGLFGGSQSTSSGLPSWNYQYTPDQMLQNSADIFNQAQQQGIDFARAMNSFPLAMNSASTALLDLFSLIWQF
jgi:phage tail tape-measure protein